MSLVEQILPGNLPFAPFPGVKFAVAQHLCSQVIFTHAVPQAKQLSGEIITF
ncbi:hypothetical protein D3C73_1006870 [compost metagenome]